MKQLVFEIIRQKWQLLTAITVLLLLNVLLGLVISFYQLPALADMQDSWNKLRNQSYKSRQMDTESLYRQGIADLETIKGRIPQKREFARVLSDLFEAAESSAVEVGAITYKPLQIKEEPLLSYQLSLSVTGSYAAVKSYLADLQNSKELIVVDSVAFSNTNPLEENVIMNLHISVYLREGA